MMRWARYTEYSSGRLGFVNLDRIVAIEQIKVDSASGKYFTRLFSGAICSTGDGDHGSWYIDADEPIEHFWYESQDQRERPWRAPEAPPDLLAAAIDYHRACDQLMAMLIQRDPDFFPSKSKIWPAIEGGAAIIAAHGGKL